MNAKKIGLICLLLSVMLVTVVGCSSSDSTPAPAPAPAADPAPAPEPPAQAPADQPAPAPEPATLDAQVLIEAKCIGCHLMDKTLTPQAADQWPSVIDRMIGYKQGLLTDEEKAAVTEFLQANHSK
ncbi:hypothetical protein BHU72_05435 [Desulfuribacillus stibiiarsenatis]|uniref:Cytochrome c domain-containing protein n=1 Tax=Desulfuribacillus stibiiarsenatis TaxID=1390249 RepID=A0A1E5L4W4_9FIRM|nr:hypothetical protein [Desulfuribacillus stibiiarsenatis]OEH85053.1 hypothetical protein BHU72_05435 [Desulfuribacillus stibiiarsenatis]